MEPDKLGKYELRRTLGKGAMGVVYEGFDPIIARRVAIKTVRLPDPDDLDAQEELARFKREAQAAGRLTHPNIVGVFDYGETPELAYIVMEFVDGQTLKAPLDRHERMAIGDIVRVMDDLLRGLAYSHENGVIHRDIKPANIMITSDNRVKIADFGVARIESSSMTQAGTMIGTPSYMSPEQFMGQAIDARTDLYASGVLLYQLLTGEKPFEGSVTSIMHKVLNTEPPAPSALSVTATPALDAVVRRAMAKRPEDRFATAQDFATALNEAAAGGESIGLSMNFGEADHDATIIAAAPRKASSATLPADRQAAAPSAIMPAKPGSKMPLVVGAAVVLLLAAGAGAFLLSGHKAAPVAQINPPPAAPPVISAPAAPSVAQIQGDLTDATTGLHCALLHVNALSGHGVTLGGLVGSAGPDAALATAMRALPVPVDVRARAFSGPYCSVLDTLAPFDDVLAPVAARVGVALAGATQAGGVSTLKDGDLIKLAITTPDFPAYISVDYFSHDGSVSHIFPSSTLPDTLYPAGSAMVPGDPKVDGGAIGAVGPPYGEDMVIVVASPSPLFATPPTATTASTYLPALAQALQQARANGGKIAVSAMLLDTTAK